MKRIVFVSFLIITLLCLLSPGLKGQEEAQEVESQEIGESEETSPVIEEVVEYYYNGSKKLEGKKQDEKKIGIWTEWYMSGAKKAEMEYEEGLKQGQWKEWFENGNLKSRTDYQDDQLLGGQIEYYSNGQKKSQKYYDRGVRQGRWTEFDINGNTTQLITFFDNGDKKTETTFDYTREGTIKTYSEWIEDGTKRLEQQTKNGQWHGYYKEWFDNGSLSIETQYIDGKENGLHRDYYQNGNIRMEIEMKDGKKNGRMTFWNEEGVKQWIKVYMDDRFIRADQVYE
jgi:uncharacterized protein